MAFRVRSVKNFVYPSQQPQVAQSSSQKGVQEENNDDTLIIDEVTGEITTGAPTPKVAPVVVTKYVAPAPLPFKASSVGRVRRCNEESYM
jgi:hypothetical protein